MTNCPIEPLPPGGPLAIDQLCSAHPQFAQAISPGTPVSKAAERVGLQLLKQNRPAEAAQIYYCGLVEAPKSAGIWLNYGSALDQCGLPDDAAKCFATSVEINPNQADAWLLLGLARKKAGNPAGCETAYRRAIELKPSNAIFWQCLGLLKQEQREYTIAIDCFENGVRFGEDGAALHANLGKLYYETGRLQESHAAYVNAGSREPANAHFQEMILRGSFLVEVVGGSPVDDALGHYLKGDSNKSERARKVLMDAFGFFTGFKFDCAAKRVGEKFLQLWPENAEMDYLVKAAAGNVDFERAPSEYVAGYFDSFAVKFNSMLVGVLGYDAPAKLAAMVKSHVPDGRMLDILDAGCGTGLSGPHLKPFAKSLSGVDLSKKMLEHAEFLKIYDSLTCMEVTEFLMAHETGYDLIVAADLLIYFGDLKKLFGLFHRALRPGGMLACSTENLPVEDHKLLSSGRFAHSSSHVRAAAADFKELDFSETTIRLEANKPVAGNLYLFLKD